MFVAIFCHGCSGLCVHHVCAPITPVSLTLELQCDIQVWWGPHTTDLWCNSLLHCRGVLFTRSGHPSLISFCTLLNLLCSRPDHIRFVLWYWPAVSYSITLTGNDCLCGVVTAIDKIESLPSNTTVEVVIPSWNTTVKVILLPSNTTVIVLPSNT